MDKGENQKNYKKKEGTHKSQKSLALEQTGEAIKANFVPAGAI